MRLAASGWPRIMKRKTRNKDQAAQRSVSIPLDVEELAACRDRVPEHLDRLRAGGLGAKRSLAIREYALGLEALHRFVEKEPLYRVHECVFAVLALESELVDPRL